MPRIFLTIILFTFLSFKSFCQCISGDCINGIGSYLYSDKTRAEGNWKNGKLNGKAKIFYNSGAIYEGEVVDGKKTGLGKYLFDDGSIYEGSFKDDKKHGAGKFITKSGYSEEGKYINDTLSGYATIKFLNGDKYVGYTINGQPNGNGIYYFSEGDKFEGIYKDGKRNGIGTLYYAKGGTLKGTWINGEYISGSNKLAAERNTSLVYPVLGSKNVYEVNVLLNGVLKLDMIFDTGASEVYFTPDIVMTLFKTKTIQEEDLLEGAYFVDANGGVNKSARFILKSMKIGDKIIENIPCAVSNNVDGFNLLGLSALKKLGSFEFDFKNSVIRLK